MRRKLFVFMAAISMVALEGTAQITDNDVKKGTWFKDNAFKHLDLGVEIGTAGLGLQLSTPLTSFARLRTGFTYMPAIEMPTSFGIEMFSEDPTKRKKNFSKMSQLVYDNFGMKVKDKVDMIRQPYHLWNWNVILDFYPLKNNKHWYVSAGFYLGSSLIAKAYNKTEDMQSLLAVNIYNNMYGKFVNDKMDYYLNMVREINPKAKYPDELYEVSLFDFSALGNKYENTGVNDPALLRMLFDNFKSAGAMGVHVGEYVNDVLYEEDVYIEVIDYDGEFDEETGKDPTKMVLAHRKGDVLHKAGDPYIMRPDEDGMVKADLYVNRFKPYLGIGYEGNLKKNDDRWKIAVDAGVLFWGGSPSVITHEGVDLVHDVTNVGGKVGSHVESIKKYKVWPMISVRFTHRLF